MRPIRSHRFRGRRWRIEFAKVRGQLGSCEGPRDADKTIYLDPRLKGNELVETAVHESIHALMWELDEQVFTEMAHDITRFLHRLGCLK